MRALQIACDLENCLGKVALFPVPSLRGGPLQLCFRPQRVSNTCEVEAVAAVQFVRERLERRPECEGFGGGLVVEHAAASGCSATLTPLGWW